MDGTDESSVSSIESEGSDESSSMLTSSIYESYASSEDSTDSESEEVIELDPGKTLYPMSELTMGHINEHNSKYKKYAFWWKHLNKVYDAKRVYARLSQMIKTRCEELGMTKKESVKLRREIKYYGYPQFSMKQHILRKLNISQNSVDSVRSQCIVGELKVPSWDETCKEIRTGLELIISCIESDIHPKLTNWDTIEYVDAFKYLCEERQKQINYSSQVILYGDPNQMPFQLSPWFRPESIRKYLNDYEPFHTFVDNDYFHREPAFDLLTTDHCHEVFSKQLRQWINDNSPFETGIESDEYAWPVLEQDVIRNDIPTENQLSVLSQRANRTSLLDEKLMKKRRDTILSYFINRYYTQKQLDTEQYTKWADRMQDNENRLNSLVL